MATSVLDSVNQTQVVDVAPGSFPLYTNDPAAATSKDPNPASSAANPTPQMISLTQIPQGPGSTLNADMTDGIHAVTASAAGPNLLIATDNNGILPYSTLPIPMQIFVWSQFGGM